MSQETTTSPDSFEIHSRASGPHWVAWLSRPGSDRPLASVILVGQTREEAEERARTWARTLAATPHPAPGG